MKNHTSIQRQQGGFTIVELLITIVIIGISSAGIAGLFYTSQYTQRRSMYHDLATRAAQRQIEYLRSSSYNNLATDSIITFTNDLPTELPKRKSGTVRVTEPVPGLKKLDVTITYFDSGKKQDIFMSSTVGQIGLSR